MTTIVRTVSGRNVPMYVVRAEEGCSVMVAELSSSRVYYVKRAQDETFDYGGLVPSGTLAKFLKENWVELDAATRSA